MHLYTAICYYFYTDFQIYYNTGILILARTLHLHRVISALFEVSLGLCKVI